MRGSFCVRVGLHNTRPSGAPPVPQLGRNEGVAAALTAARKVGLLRFSRSEPTGEMAPRGALSTVCGACWSSSRPVGPAALALKMGDARLARLRLVPSWSTRARRSAPGGAPLRALSTTSLLDSTKPQPNTNHTSYRRNMSSISLLNGRQAQVPAQIFINNEWVSRTGRGRCGAGRTAQEIDSQMASIAVSDLLWHACRLMLKTERRSTL